MAATTTAEDQVIVAARAISRAKSANQLRVAIGATLKEISAAYRVAEKLPKASLYGPKQAKGELDRDRLALETDFGKVGPSGNMPVNDSTAEGVRQHLRRAWVTICGIRGGAAHDETWSGLTVLADAIVEAPAVVLKSAQAVVEQTGKAAGGLLGSLLVGTWPIIIAAAIVALLYLRAQRSLIP